MGLRCSGLVVTCSDSFGVYSSLTLPRFAFATYPGLQYCVQQPHNFGFTHAETTQPEPMAARPQCHTIRITAEVPKSGTTLERLDLPVREEFYDSVGRALPALASSEALVLDMHAAAETLLLDCSLPTQLVPSLAEVLMLSKALTTALAVACQQLGCMHFGYTLQLNNHTALVKNLHTAETRLCPVENGCVPSIARVTLATQGLREPSNLEIIVTGCSSSSCSFVAKLPGQLKAVRLEILQQDLQLGQYLVECPNIVRKYQSTFHIEVQQGSLRGDFYTIESFQSLAAVHNRRASGKRCAAPYCAMLLCCSALCCAELCSDGFVS